ncbi:MAG: helix-turn-helix domain-containing protein, partial [Jatrophihabitantaceae bacterium]
MDISASSTPVDHPAQRCKYLGGVVPKVLAPDLRALERDGLVIRRVYAEVPPRVEYTLTDLGRSLQEPIAAVQIWTERNVSAVLAARERADA